MAKLSSPSSANYLEDRVEKRLGDGLKALFTEDRYFYFKFKPFGIIGVPDRILILPGLIMFIELKKPGGIVKPWQERMHDKLARLGCWVEVLSSIEDVDALVGYLKRHYG